MAYGFGIVGCGMIANFHARAVAEFAVHRWWLVTIRSPRQRIVSPRRLVALPIMISKRCVPIPMWMW